MKIPVSQLRQIIREEVIRLHEVRHGQIIRSGVATYRVDNKDPEWTVLTTMDGIPVARQSKGSAGRVYQQSWTNPDYEGRDSYELQYLSGDEWVTYDSQARKGEIFNDTFLRRISTR